MKALVISIITLFYSHSLFATDTTSTKYYPLQIGNRWTYYSQNYWQNYRFYTTIVKDSLTLPRKSGQLVRCVF